MNESDAVSGELQTDLERAEMLIREQRAVITALADLVCELMQTLAEYERANPGLDTFSFTSNLN